MRFALLLSIVVVAYNNLINRWPPFHGTAYVPVNLAFGGANAVVTAAALGVSRNELGLQGDVGDTALPLMLVVLFALITLGIARSRHGHRIADARVEGMHGGALAFYVLARIPLGTAVTEEVVFRGVLFAAWREAGTSSTAAALYASLAFGLWHVAPTIIGVRMNDPEAGSHTLQAAVAAAVVLTTIAGLVLTWLRLRSGGVLAPIVLHAGVNSVGALAAVTARRRGRG